MHILVVLRHLCRISALSMNSVDPPVLDNVDDPVVCVPHMVFEHRRTALCCWSLHNAKYLLPFCCTKHSAFLLALSRPCAEWSCRHPSLTEKIGHV